MNNLSKEEQTVLQLITDCPNRITQLQIARKAPELGSHAEHEGYMTKDSTLRKIRQVIRDLRLKHGYPILSDVGKDGGYWILKSQHEAQEYINRTERTAKAVAKSYQITYHTMKKNFNIHSPYFEQQGKLF